MEPISIILALAGLAVGGVLTFVVTRKNNNGIVAAAEERLRNWLQFHFFQDHVRAHIHDKK